MTHSLLLQERRLQKEEMQKRLKAIMKHPGNRFCSECTEPKPTWAFLLEPPIEGGVKLGALCCYKCYTYHFRLKKTCTVKSANMASEWTSSEVSILEKTGGNLLVNSIYEAFLDSESKKTKKADMKSFVENKYQNLKFFSERTYHEQTTIRDINRRSSTHHKKRSNSGSQRQRSGSTHNDKKKKQEATVLDKEKRPTLIRSVSNTNGRFLLQSMSDHLRHQSGKKHSRPTSRSSCQKQASALDEPQDHSKVRSLSTRSISRDKLKALSDHARRSTRNLNFGVDCSGKPKSLHPASRKATTQGDRLVVSDHGKKHSSSAAYNQHLRCSSHERLLVHHKAGHHRTKPPAHNRPDQSELRPQKIPSVSRQKRHDEDFVPTKPRRRSGLEEEKSMPLSSLHRTETRETTQASTGRSFKLHKTSSWKLNRLERSFPKDLDTSDEGIGYDLPLYLGGHSSCPCIMDDISDLTSSGINTSAAAVSDSDLDESFQTKNTTDRDFKDEKRATGSINGVPLPSSKLVIDDEQETDIQSESSSLAAYMKRYRQSKLEAPPMVSSTATTGTSTSQTSNAKTSSDSLVPLRSALENLEKTILDQPIMILLNRTQEGSRRHHDTASGLVRGDRAPGYWQAKLAPIVNGIGDDNDVSPCGSDSYSFTSQGKKNSPKMAVASTPLSTADMTSASGRAQAA